MADVLPIDQDAAAGHLVEAGDEVAQGGLAAAVGAGDDNEFCVVNNQIDIFQNLFSICGKRDVL